MSLSVKKGEGWRIVLKNGTDSNAFMCICIYTLDIDNKSSYTWRYKFNTQGELLMKTVNALKIRNHLGEVLDMLNKTSEPIFVSKGREIKAVLITPEQYKRRFLDYQSEERKKQLLEVIEGMKADSIETKDSVAVLRELRGYEK